MNTQFFLTPQERDLLLERVSGMNDASRARLLLGIVEGDVLRFEFPEKLYHQFVDDVEYVVATTNDEGLLRILLRLYDDVDLDDDGFFEEEDEDWEEEDEDWEEGDEEWEDEEDADEHILNKLEFIDQVFEQDGDLMEELARAIAENKPESLEEAEELMASFMEKHSHQPMKVFDGLSPDQVDRAINVDWDDPESFIMLRDTIPPELLVDNIMLDNARLFLGMVRDQGGVKADTKGDLNREFVNEIWPRFKRRLMPPPECDSKRKNWEEESLPPLVTLRYVLMMAGLVRKTKAVFKITRKGERMFAPGKEGALLALLFHTYFREFNIASNDHLHALPELQLSIVYTLFMLKRHAADWTTLKQIKPHLLPPFTWKIIPKKKVVGHPLWRLLVESRIFEPLLAFGLLESSSPDMLEAEESVRFRITPLFEALMSFQVE